MEAIDDSFLCGNRQRLIAARKEAKQIVHESDVIIIEVKNGDAILRSATDLHPSGSLRMAIPFRERCAYSFTGGMCVALRILNK